MRTPTSSPPWPFAFLNPPLAVVNARVPAGPPPPPLLDSLEDEEARPAPLPLPPRVDCPFLAFGTKAFGPPRLVDGVFAAAAAAARGTGGARPLAVAAAAAAAGSADPSGLRRTRWRGLALAGGTVAAAALAAVAAGVCWDDDVVLLLSGHSDSCVANAGDMA